MLAVSALHELGALAGGITTSFQFYQGWLM